jgi:NADH-quinone oxidoreductase subunit N
MLLLSNTNLIFDFFENQTGWIAWLYLSPEIFLALTCLSILIITAIAHFKTKSFNFWKQKFFSVQLIKTTIRTLIIVIVLYIWLGITNPYVSLNLASNYLYVDSFTLWFKTLILLTGIFVLTNSIQYLTQHLRNCIEYSFIILLTLFFLVVLVSATSLMLMFVCIIGFSLNLYVLILYDAPYQPALEAAVKYFYLSALSSGLIASGLLITYIWLFWNKFQLISYTLHYMV